MSSQQNNVVYSILSTIHLGHRKIILSQRIRYAVTDHCTVLIFDIPDKKAFEKRKKSWQPALYTLSQCFLNYENYERQISCPHNVF